MQVWEKRIHWLRERLWLYQLLCVLLCGGIFYVGSNVDALPLKKLGKSLGAPAAYLGGACFAYYLLREGLVRGKRNHWNLSGTVESAWKRGLKLLRLLHPMLGILAFYLVLLHGGLLLWAGTSLRSSRMVSGLAEGGLAVLLLLTGLWLTRQTALRRWHRSFAWIMLLLFLLHVYLKLRF